MPNPEGEGIGVLDVTPNLKGEGGRGRRRLWCHAPQPEQTGCMQVGDEGGGTTVRKGGRQGGRSNHAGMQCIISGAVHTPTSTP